MCGLAGVVAIREGAGAELSVTVQRMNQVLRHRGPDSDGIWVDAKAGVALGHRRLAIIDLTEEGHQPMHSASGRFVIVYNGEIYNFGLLSAELKSLGQSFRGHSDTEVLLAAVETWGLEPALQKLVGMFAFALWDRRTQTLHLVRDRLGKKPLYFGWAGQDLVFASELKSFHEHPDFVPEVDRRALALFLRYGYVPVPHSIYCGVFKLKPGSSLSLPAAAIGALRTGNLLTHVRDYWSVAEVAQRGLAAPLALSEAEAVEQLDELLDRVIADRMVADVPLGALLSGGIDSSTVVAFMQRRSARRIRTFSIGFHERGYDEAAGAKRVADHLGTDHTELYVTPTEAQAVIPSLPEIYDEPFADSSQIPTFLLSQLARNEVTVALSGDGGDEILGGYNRYVLTSWVWQRMRLCPRVIRQGLAASLAMIPPAGWDKVARGLDRMVPRAAQQPRPGYQMAKFASLLAADGPDALYRLVTARWLEPSAVVLGDLEPPLAELAERPRLTDSTDRLMLSDAIGYLPDDILVKVDRASMAVSLEVRAPLLDHRLVEFAWRLPRTMKIRGREGKWVLRQVLYRHVPQELVDRPKQGFDVPLDTWLRGPLRDWAEGMLAPARLAAEGFFDPLPIRDLWSQHLAGRRNWAIRLWPILMFQAWQERWLAAPAAMRRVGVRARGPGAVVLSSEPFPCLSS